MTKKKFTHILLSLLMVLPLFFSFFSGVKTALAAETNATQNILLHKRVFRDRDYVNNFGDKRYQNTGDIVSAASGSMEMLEQSDGLNGATFVLVDVTNYYYAVAAEAGYDEAEDRVQANITRSELRNPTSDVVDIEDGYPQGFIVDKQTTTSADEVDADLPTEVAGEDGILLFPDVPKVSDGRDAVYLIVETEVDNQSNVDLNKLSSKMLVAFPFIQDDGVEFSGEFMHLYPKNLGYARDPWFMKLGRDLNGEVKPLEGAEFVFYRLNEGNKEYLIPNPDPTSLIHEWITDAELDAQGNAVYDSLVEKGIEIYTSNVHGIVSMDGALLPSGTYYFEEVKSVPGYMIVSGARGIPVVIPAAEDTVDGEPAPVMVNNQRMAEPEPDWEEAFADGFSFEKAIAAAWIEEFDVDGLPYVYNDQAITFEKELMEEQHDFAYGEAINYQISTSIPVDLTDFEYIRIMDQTDGKLQYIEDSLKVTIGEVELTTEELENVMTVTLAAGNAGFTAELNLDYLSEMEEYLGQALVLDYQMFIAEGADTDTDLINGATLFFSHSGYEQEIDSEEQIVYTGGRRFQKVDLDDAQKTLAGAKFVILNSDNKYLALVDGAVTWVNAQADAKVLTSDNAGEFAIQGLNYGTYQLKEIAAPSGYQLLSSPVSFTVEQGSYLVDEVAASNLAIANVKEKPTTPGKLPQTGESSMSWMLGLGLLLLAIAAAIYTLKKKATPK